MELIDIQSNDMLKDKFKVRNFFRYVLQEQFSDVRVFAHSLVSVFGTVSIVVKKHIPELNLLCLTRNMDVLFLMNVCS
jgi:hypothetical protein